MIAFNYKTTTITVILNDVAIGLLDAEIAVGNIIALILLELVFAVSYAGFKDLKVVKTNLPHISLAITFVI